MAAIMAALQRCAVERAIHVNKPGRERAVFAHLLTAKGIKHRLRTRRRIDFKCRSTAGGANDDVVSSGQRGAVDISLRGDQTTGTRAILS